MSDRRALEEKYVMNNCYDYNFTGGTVTYSEKEEMGIRSPIKRENKNYNF